MAPRRRKPRQAKRGSDGRDDVVGDAHRQQAAGAAAVGRNEGHAAADRRQRIVGRQQSTIDRYRTAARRQAEQRLAEPVLARIGQAADAEDLAGARPSKLIVVEAGRMEVLHRQHR